MANKALGGLAFVFGLFILIGSIIMFIAASSTVDDYETTMGQVARSLDPEAQDEYETALGMQVCSGVGIAIGAIFSFVGGYLLFRPEPQQQQPQPYYQQPYQQPYYQQPYYQPPPQQPYRPPYQPPQQPPPY